MTSIEPDEGTLHDICWNILMNNKERPIGWVALEAAKQTAEACLGHPVKPFTVKDPDAAPVRVRVLEHIVLVL